MIHPINPEYNVSGIEFGASVSLEIVEEEDFYSDFDEVHSADIDELVEIFDNEIGNINDAVVRIFIFIILLFINYYLLFVLIDIDNIYSFFIIL